MFFINFLFNFLIEKNCIEFFKIFLYFLFQFRFTFIELKQRVNNIIC